jgi:hypothetical protein
MKMFMGWKLFEMLINYWETIILKFVQFSNETKNFDPNRGNLFSFIITLFSTLVVVLIINAIIGKILLCVQTN